jgi:3-hydroxy-9,10-secoandrosta-1,3,5(10)-triene-9,17-dione monooxygenase reductase component
VRVTESDTGDLHRAAPVDPGLLRTVCGLYVTGVTVITSGEGKRAVATTVNSFTSVSLRPPMVLFCLHNQSRLRPAVADSRAYVVNFLAGRHDRLARSFAGRETASLGQVAHHPSETGVPVLSEALAFLSCRLVDTFAGGDHSIFLGEVISLGIPHPHHEPLIFFRGSLGSLAEEPHDGRPIMDG